MRMWMIDPRLMCSKHLCGEHVECHMLVGSILKNRNIEGFLARGLLEPQNLQTRHDALAAEMGRRGFHHKSPLKPYSTDKTGAVLPRVSILELSSRCEKCRQRIHRLKVHKTESYLR